MKYRPKPVEVEAWQFKRAEDFPRNMPRWLRTARNVNIFEDRLTKNVWLDIPNLKSTIRAYLGDWIIRDPNGNLSVVKDEIFRETYERIGPDFVPTIDQYYPHNKATAIAKDQDGDGSLTEKLRQSAKAVAALTEEERRAMYEAQRESWAKQDMD